METKMKAQMTKLFAVLLILGVSIVGCDQSRMMQNNESTDFIENADLNAEYGGVDTGNEAPGFGDSDLTGDESSSTADPVAANGSTNDALNDASVQAYFLRIGWGLLEGDSTATDVYEWPGKIEITDGVLAVLKKNRFERSDSLVLPRPNNQSIEFFSKTSKHFDGLSLVIIDSSNNASGQLTISLGQFNISYNYSDLDSIDSIIETGIGDNDFAIVGHSKQVTPFAGGFFVGKWRDNPGERGEFKGRWIRSTGETNGFLKGFFGKNDAGRSVLFGKYIHADGSFGGRLVGEYGSARNSFRHGWLQGRWENADGELMGKFRGKWKTRARGMGVMRGRWVENTNE
jgi:hypothetical protein